MYKNKLDVRSTQLAIQNLKFTFTKKLSQELNLIRVSAPLFVEKETKINDGLNGEKPVNFNPKYLNKELEVIHSLAKWKRYALKKYQFKKYEGLWTDMNAIRQEEEFDNIHSIYVDQWDWEMIISKKDRTLEYLEKTVLKIYNTIRYVENKINFEYPQLSSKLPKNLVFISSEELLEKYPNLNQEERENEFAKLNKAFFVYKVGYPLKNGKPQSERAFDYDDWNLNGDLIFWDKVNEKAIEISSMGIRVDSESLLKQAKFKNIDELSFGDYHNKILKNEMPFTIGGGIGQSRLSMFLLEKKHIGEVQVGIWPDHIIDKCKEEEIILL
ncbi:aspartate--ammonia ligase [Mycoplasmopsis lipofaciens]|uniref:aspartate--ammonia ligase n=1 Tax=Mycoplasmopsis lipofaciens TaxID=114884 RepID=UPI00048285C5|nr:aspartate--ammonia ligase [Mycoplasmopsis lipofaciens]